jgi:hypothetical protein
MARVRFPIGKPRAIRLRDTGGSTPRQARTAVHVSGEGVLIPKNKGFCNFTWRFPAQLMVVTIVDDQAADREPLILSRLSSETPEVTARAVVPASRRRLYG